MKEPDATSPTRVIVSRLEKAHARLRRFGMATLLLLVILNIAGLVLNFATLVRSDQTTHHIDECLFPPIPPEKPDPNGCFAKLARSGKQGTVRLMDYQACWAAYPVEQRVAKVFEDCKMRVFPEVN